MNDTTQHNGLQRDESGHWLRMSDQPAVAGLVALGLVVLGAGRWYGGRESLAESVGEGPLGQFQVDVNRAGAAELALLPGIGTTLAERIIQSRQVEGPFQEPAQLKRVNGIGPVKAKQIAAYLFFLPPAEGNQQGLLRPARRFRWNLN